ncbi:MULTISPECIES: SMI1/KNR4 family protein [Henriciella]|jgi:hypothetical protein|uniref:SMI1/KNR4 family protein n=1 Tax=Henriciella TaxID=453849 RepID=UPI0035192D49
MADLTQELFWKLNREQPRFPSGRVLFGQGGLTDSEIRSIEDQLEMALPPDFKFLLENLKDPGGVFFPWADFSLNLYRELIEWVWDGIAFDIGHGLWLDRWGERPSEETEAKHNARLDFESWPVLLPIFGHRFLPATPCRSGNPVFSIKQTDIIYYGANLADYLLNELTGSRPLVEEQTPIRKIDVWSDFAEGRLGWWRE